MERNNFFVRNSETILLHQNTAGLAGRNVKRRKAKANNEDATDCYY